ncbi:NUDIX hydrolase [Dyadobacter sp. CY312]|uniref:NUDIX hydrolase n=1 Tax=Dyadobacter sp. CY312 TaxID=2907303 RepID=UPI001F24278C|nr:NUDIX hydrolase [Dyadobacter sp. CY312]MCE7039851.1 NUDIX hydrolase [Dyadobacter sp. CY312]
MNRNSLLSLLDAYNTTDVEEAEMLTEMKNFVATNKDCFERTFAPGHVTASGWIVSETGDQVLLMHHRKLNRWFQPGGHCDGDPDVLAVARKEVEEETGLLNFRLANEGIFDVDIHLIPANSKDAAHYHYDVRFLFKADAQTELVINSESRDLRWISLSKVQDYNNSESIMRMARKAIF